LAKIEKEFREKGPSESLFAKADTLMRMSPIENLIDSRKYLGR